MTDKKMNVITLSNALNRLQEGLARYEQNKEDLQIRDGLIQRFEFTYEASHKTLKRYIKIHASDPSEFDQVDFQYIIRSGCQQGLLLGEWADWRYYRDMRSKTSHTYDELIAIEVVQGIPKFIKEAEFLKTQLENKLK